MIEHAQTFLEFRDARIRSEAKCPIAILHICEPERLDRFCQRCFEETVVKQLNKRAK